MTGNFVSNNCRVVPTRLGAATTPVVCHTALGFTQAVEVRIANAHATSTPTVNLIYKPIASGTSFFYLANYVMPVAGSLWFDFSAFAMYENDQLLVQQSIANCLDVFVAIAEVPGRSQ